MQTDSFIGRKINDYTIQERIGIGGMATVYRAHQASVNRSVAFKIIRLDPNAGETSEFARRFEQEAKVIAALENLHILPIYDYGIFNNELAYIAMRLLRGGSLSQQLSDGALDLDRTCDVFTQIARGLSYAHQHDVIHRDLKPSNILMDNDGNAYLTDFGLAKSLVDSQDLTKTGTIVGTPVYTSPEQLRGEGALGTRSDLYSMGVILYHMLVGRPPFDSSESNMISIIYKHLEELPKPPREINPTIPIEVEAVIMKALKKNPAERFATADEMSIALNNALGRRISTSSFTVPTGSRPAIRPPSQPTITLPTEQVKRPTWLPVALIAAVIALIVISVGTVLLTANPSPTPMVLATVIPDTTGVPADIVPTEDDIVRALARLGSNGFMGYIACNQNTEYHAAQAREMREFATAYGITLRIYDGDNDEYRQITEIERARADGVGALIICPLAIDLLAETLTSAESANLPLAFMAGGIPTYGGVLIGGDDYLLGLEGGRGAGRVIRDEMDGEANVIVLDFPTMPVIVVRADGMVDGVLEYAPDANIVGRYIGGTRDNGYNSVNQLLEEGVEFDAIISINDAGTYGAIDALVEAEIDPASVIIGSVDAEALARQYIRDGYYLRSSVAVSREVSSQTGVDVLVKLLAGATMPELILVPPGSVVTQETLTTLE